MNMNRRAGVCFETAELEGGEASCLIPIWQFIPTLGVCFVDARGWRIAVASDERTHSQSGCRRIEKWNGMLRRDSISGICRNLRTE